MNQNGLGERDAMDTPAFLHPLPTDLDWSELRFPGESELRGEIEKRPALIEIAERWSDPATSPRPTPFGFLAGGVKAGPHFCPSLAQIALMLRDVLRMPVEPVLYVFPWPEWFVELKPASKDEAVAISISSALPQSLGVREMLFVLGRSIARRLLGQRPMVADPTAGVEKRDQQTLLLRGLWRFQEMTCDRVGLLCCQYLDLACTAILKSASGLPDDLLGVDFELLLADRTGEEEAMVGGSEHEFTMLRLAALRQFSESARYRDLTTSSTPPPEGSTKTLELPNMAALASAADPAPAVAATVEHAEPLGEFEPLVEEPETQPAVKTAAAELGRTAARVGAAAAKALSAHPCLPSVRFVLPRHPPRLETLTTRSTKLKVAPESTPAKMQPVAVAELVSSGFGSFKAGDPVDEARKDFTLWGSLWVMGARSALGERTRAELWEFFGSEAVAAMEDASGPIGEQRCVRTFKGQAATLTGLPLELRLGVLEDVLHLATADGELGAREHEKILDLALLLDLSVDQVRNLAAEYVDPEFARYKFREGQEVEVRLDDDWVVGVVRRLEPCGDLRVHFPSGGETLWLNPTADLIRPLDARQIR